MANTEELLPGEIIVSDEEEPKETKTKKTRKKKEKVTAELFEEHFHVTMWFTHPVLGAKPGTTNLWMEYNVKKAPDGPTREQELSTNTVEDVAAKGVTVFLRRTLTGKPCIESFTLKGYFKDGITGKKRQEGSVAYNEKEEAAKAHKSKIASNIYIYPPYIHLQFPPYTVKEKTEEEFQETGFGKYDVITTKVDDFFTRYRIKNYDRQMKAQTPQGERVSIASSECAPPGTKIEFDLEVEVKDFSKILFETLMKGYKHGTNQNRGSDLYGNFVCEIRKEDGEIYVENTSKVIGCTSDDPEFEEMLISYLQDFNL